MGLQLLFIVLRGHTVVRTAPAPIGLIFMTLSARQSDGPFYIVNNEFDTLQEQSPRRAAVTSEKSRPDCGYSAYTKARSPSASEMAASWQFFS
jgi:hypothetical protein